MPLDTERVDLAAERESIREKMEELADEQANWQGNDDHARELLQQGVELENREKILGHMADEWDVEHVTLAGLTAGEVNLVEDIVDRNATVRERDAWVAVGTRKAPYLEHTPSELSPESVEETVANVVDLPLAYVRWAEGKISELSHLDPDVGNGYLSMVRERSDASTTGENG